MIVVRYVPISLVKKLLQGEKLISRYCTALVTVLHNRLPAGFAKLVDRKQPEANNTTKILCRKKRWC